MASNLDTPAEPPLAVLDEPLRAELPAFEFFFKTFGFKRTHGRIWGLLVLADRPLSSKEIVVELEISQGTVSTTLNELTEWGAITSQFDPARRCHLHSPVGNAVRIVATVFRRREQVAFQQFKQTSNRALEYIRSRHGERDPRVLTLRSIITTCELAEALMQLVLSTVTNALDDSESLLSKAVHAALRVGIGAPSKLFQGFRSQETGAATAPYEQDAAPDSIDELDTEAADTNGAHRHPSNTNGSGAVEGEHRG